MGYIETRQGEGNTVKIFKPEDVGMPDFQSFLVSKETIFELMEARKSLEISNAGLAAEKRIEEDLKILQENLNMMVQAIANQDSTLAQQMMAKHLAHFEHEMKNYYNS